MATLTWIHWKMLPIVQLLLLDEIIVFLQQDGTPPHYVLAVQQELDNFQRDG